MPITVDLEKRRIVFVSPGKDEATIQALSKYLKSKGVEPNQITHAAMDMSVPYISGLKKYFPDTAIIFDRFHLKKVVNKSIDELRKAERRQHTELKGSKYIFLKN